MLPDWSRDVVWYHLYPLGFLDAERNNPAAGEDDGFVTHRLPHLERWLDYLVALGVRGILLGPVFESESHGYDTVDYRRVDRRLGDEGDLVQFFDACHQRGLRVLLDGVFNHVGRRFPPFADVLQRRNASSNTELFRIDFNRSGPDGFAYDTFEGHSHLVALNHASDAVLDLVSNAAAYWLERGSDGFRLDAAYAVSSEFWRRFTDRIRRTHPNAYLMGEVIHGDYSLFVQETGLDAVTQYELWKAIWSSLNDRNFYELAWALARHQQFCESFLPFTFIGNHDVTRIASNLDDKRHLPMALVTLMTVPGTPAIYAGDELGWRGVKYDRPGGDDEIRPSFPDQPSGIAVDDWAFYRLHQELIELRHRYPWLCNGYVETLHLANRQLVYQTMSGSGERLLVIMNTDDQPFSVDIRWDNTAEPAHVAGHPVTTVMFTGTLQLTGLAPHGWSILFAPNP